MGRRSEQVSVPKPPPLPVYDPDKDGNVFQWIQRASQEAKAARMVWHMQRRWRRPLAP